MTFVPGQRWLSTAEPELGLGTVLRADARQVQVLFATSGVMRVYANQSAPLLRASFRVGDRIRAQGQSLLVTAVTERGGILQYTAGDQSLPEGALDDVQNISKADDRLLSGRIDRSDRFDLRLEALERRARARQSAAYGVLSARIDLIPHQLRVAQVASERRPPRILFADEVGLGKTIEACLVVAKSIAQGRAQRVLIVVPEALVYQWFVELRRRFNLNFAIYDEERAESIDREGGGRNPFADEQCVLTHFGFLLGAPERARQVLQAEWDLLVVDEAHHLWWSPEQTSPEYQLAAELAQKTPGTLLLTATPEQLGRSGHFARLRLLDPARFHDLAAYQAESAGYLALSAIAETLSEGGELNAAQRALLQQQLAQQPDQAATALLDQPHPEARQQLLQSLIDRHGTGRVMFRNRRASVGGFPQRKLHAHLLPEAGVAPELPAALVEEFLGDVANPPFSPALNYAHDPRLEWLLGLLAQHANDKFLLICRTQAKLHALDEALRLRGTVSVSRFHEGLGIVQRDRAAANFAAPDGARLMLCTEIGSEGRNFQFAQHLVLWDLPIDPDLLEQRIGRLDRIGQSGTVHIHFCTLAGSAQHAVLRWYDEALNALESSLEDGRELFKRFGERLVDGALNQARGQADAADVLQSLITETRAAHSQLAQALHQGRDRLLELSARSAPGAEALLESLAQADADTGSDEFILRLFELYGVEVEDVAPRTVVLDPELMTVEAFAGLAEPCQATFDRRTALAREELVFLRVDHPMIAGAIELLLSSETGNAAFVVDDTLPPKNAVLETVFVLECVAPAGLAVERFLPPTPLRIPIDAKLAHRPNWRADARSLVKASERNIEVTRYRKILATLLPPMLHQATEAAGQAAQVAVQQAELEAQSRLGQEIERLRALAAVNPSIRPTEIAAAEDELAMLLELLPAATPRLDAIRLVVSADFLKLRA